MCSVSKLEGLSDIGAFNMQRDKLQETILYIRLWYCTLYCKFTTKDQVISIMNVSNERAHANLQRVQKSR